MVMYLDETGKALPLPPDRELALGGIAQLLPMLPPADLHELRMNTIPRLLREMHAREGREVVRGVRATCAAEGIAVADADPVRGVNDLARQIAYGEDDEAEVLEPTPLEVVEPIYSREESQ